MKTGRSADKRDKAAASPRSQGIREGWRTIDDDFSDLIAARRRPRRAGTGVEQTVAKIQYENMLAGIDARLAGLRAKKQEFARGSDEYLRIDEDIVSAELDWFRLAEYCDPRTDKRKANAEQTKQANDGRRAASIQETIERHARGLWKRKPSFKDNNRGTATTIQPGVNADLRKLQTAHPEKVPPQWQPAESIDTHSTEKEIGRITKRVGRIVR